MLFQEVYWIRTGDTSKCHHCVNRLEDPLEHTLEVCPAWVELRRVLEAIGGGDLSQPALVEAMVRVGAEAWGPQTELRSTALCIKPIYDA